MRHQGKTKNKERIVMRALELNGKGKKEVKCFNCEGDHYISQCQELLELQKVREEGRITAATWEDNTFCTYQVNTIRVEGFSPMEVLLDNQLDISIMKLELLRMLELAEKSIRVNGVGSVQLVAHQTGYFQDFFECMQVGIPKRTCRRPFTVHLPKKDLGFHRRSKLHVADFAEQGNWSPEHILKWKIVEQGRHMNH
jgi:hypothetical protein